MELLLTSRNGEKAFHQIEPNDRRMLRFLWLNDISKEKPGIVHYQFCRLVFGLTPSPAILSSLIDHHLDRRAEEHAEIVSLLKRSFYVDDLVSGAWDDAGAVEVYDKSNRIMEEGGFKLRKWTSNSQAFRKHVAKETLEDFTAVEFRETQDVKTLGSESGSAECLLKNNECERDEFVEVSSPNVGGNLYMHQ